MTETLKVVEVLAVPEDECAETAPERREAVILQPGQRHHAEIEPAISVRPSPLHQLDEEVFHHSARRLLGEISHEVQRELFAAFRRPDVGKRDHAPIPSDDAGWKQGEVALVEVAQ